MTDALFGRRDKGTPADGAIDEHRTQAIAAIRNASEIGSRSGVPTWHERLRDQRADQRAGVPPAAINPKSLLARSRENTSTM